MGRRVLRPMSYIEIFDEAFDLYRRHFVLFVGIALLVSLASMPSLLPGARFAFFLLLMPCTFVEWCAMTWAISECYLGKKPTISGAYGMVLARLWPMLLTAVMCVLLVYIGILLLVIPGIVFLFWIAFAVQVFTLEYVSGYWAIRRSRQLAGGCWKRIFVMGLLTMLLVEVLRYALTLPFAFFAGAPLRPYAHFHGWLYYLSVLVSGTLVGPVQAIAWVIFYYDIRVRKEGFDVEVLAKEMRRSKPREVDV